ncbi:MAG TPA: MBL fold metallo-hydrolase [Vicinamibacterales bacterium]|nr:MBL fold metallo-hydrolase [Vicinamibacterales bacterium]
MIVDVRAEPPFYKNGFVVGCERTREGVIIDPGDEVDGLLASVRDHDLAIKYILLTHAHIDHITGVDTAKNAVDAPVYLHKDDLFLYDSVEQQGAKFGFKVRRQPPVDVFYDLTPIYFGDYEVRVHHTPGHCPGGVCLQFGTKGTAGTELFVGDTLFAGSIGRTDLPGGDYETLLQSITEVLFPLGDDSVVHSGHGPDTTIGRERKTNPFVLEYLAAGR